eukprot:SM000061S19219  [mRNA]  locus=s61:267048:270175:+ [translate_table: standard]
MRGRRLRVAMEGWNFCNKAGPQQTPAEAQLDSPRWADCADLQCPDGAAAANTTGCTVRNLVTDEDNWLRFGDGFPAASAAAYENASNPDDYAMQKEHYLASLCEVVEEDDQQQLPWHFWMIMLKNGNFNPGWGFCPHTATHNDAQAVDGQGRYGHGRERQNTRFRGDYTKARLSTVSGTAERLSYVMPARSFRSRRASCLRTSGGCAPGPWAPNEFPCFGPGCMNQPIVQHQWSEPQHGCQPNGSTNSTVIGIKGGFSGTYDITHPDSHRAGSDGDDMSFFSVEWEKDPDSGSWTFRHQLDVSTKYPWLMLYLRADATSGVSGGKPWDSRGLMRKVPVSPDFRVRLTLNVTRGGGSKSQFYLIDLGGCWKNDGRACDGNVTTDVTRYAEMIINPEVSAWCSRWTLHMCPPYHTFVNGTQVHRSDIERYPYSAYHYYCGPSNARHAEQPFGGCDPFSNPQPQELMQLVPHPEWAPHGFPSTAGEGWIGDPRTWELDAGALSARLNYYQAGGSDPECLCDPGSPPAKRVWPSLDVGTEIFISPSAQTAEWTLSDFDVLVPPDSLIAIH